MLIFIKKQLLITLSLSIFAVASLSANTLTQTQKYATLSIVSSFLLSNSVKATALDKISNYAESNGASGQPTVADYENIGVTQVTARILVAVNEVVVLKVASEVDTLTELNLLINEVLSTSPVITLIGNSIISLALNSSYIEDNATAIDNIDGDISTSIIISGEVNSSQEGNYTLRYNVKDFDNNTAIEVNRNISISDTNDTSPPTFDGVTNQYNVSVKENQLIAIDINASDDYSIRYSIKDGNSSYFMIDVGTGLVTFKVAPDYESGIHFYTFTVVISDGTNNDERNVSINITNIDDFPPVFASNANVSVDEDTRIAIELNATDTDTITYSIANGDSHLFSIIPSTGVVSFLTLPDYDRAQHSYTFIAIASDSLNETNQTVLITINDLNDEDPVFTMDTNVTVKEEQISAITLTASDLDTNSTLAYTIKDGNASLFKVNTSSGEVQFNTLPDYESGNIFYFFTAKVNDGINSSERNITIHIEEVFETNLKKTGQNISYNKAGAVIPFDNNFSDDGFYQKGQLYAYSRSSAGVVYDNITRLEWQDNISSVFKKWVENIASPNDTTGDTAIEYCNTLVLDGKNNWRLPTYIELETLIDYSLTNSMFDSSFINIKSSFYWTSTKYVDTQNKLTHTWVISAGDAKDNQLSRDNSAFVMCVRNK